MSQFQPRPASPPEPESQSGSRPAPIVQKSLRPLPEPVAGAVITVSDRCAAGQREDVSGPLAARLLAEHDVIVEAVRVVPDGAEPVREAVREGLEAQIRAHGLTKTPLAGLSRGLVGVTGRDDAGALVVNAPGSRGGVEDTVAVIGPLVPHVLEQLRGGDH